MRGRTCRPAPISSSSGSPRRHSRCPSSTSPGRFPSADLYDYAFYVMRPRLARVAGAGQVAVASSDTREIEVVVDPARLLTAGLTIHDVSERLHAANTLAPVGRSTRPAGSSRSCWLGSVAVNRRDRTDAGFRPPRRRAATAGRGRGDAGLARSHRAHHRERPRRGQHQRLAAGRRQHPRDRNRHRAGGVRARAHASCGTADYQGLRSRGIRARRNRECPRCDPARRLSRGRHPALVPARLAPHAGRVDHAAARGADDVWSS